MTCTSENRARFMAGLLIKARSNFKTVYQPRGQRQVECQVLSVGALIRAVSRPNKKSGGRCLLGWEPLQLSEFVSRFTFPIGFHEVDGDEGGLVLAL